MIGIERGKVRAYCAPQPTELKGLPGVLVAVLPICDYHARRLQYDEREGHVVGVPCYFCTKVLTWEDANRLDLMFPWAEEEPSPHVELTASASRPPAPRHDTLKRIGQWVRGFRGGEPQTLRPAPEPVPTRTIMGDASEVIRYGARRTHARTRGKARKEA